jgi:ferritin-like metal-binding protein YciE
LAGDSTTAGTASLIEGQERAMGHRLAECFDLAVDAALRELDPDDLAKQLDKYLADAHAIEAQALVLLGRAPDLAGSPELASAYSSHRALVAARLDARDASPSRLKDAALSLGALNWGAFFAIQPDTPAKLAAFAYAFEHLEVAAYELLRRVAMRAGDEETEHIADRILGEENAAAAQLRSLFDQALDASLAEQGVAAR